MGKLNSDDVLNFWFKETKKEQHYKKDPEFDKLIREKFLSTYTAITAGECFKWRQTPKGRLAEIIVLDQFSRNMFRDQPEAFKYDSLALALAQECILQGDDKKIPEEEGRSFIYMPFMHSESLMMQEMSLELFNNSKYAVSHHAIVARFGRFPHRNRILGRENTPEETEFLTQPGSSF